MPSGIYPEVAFPRIVVIAQSPGLAVKDVEVAVTRPIEEAVSIVLGVIRVRSKSVRGAAELDDRLRARHRHGPGAQRRARPDGRSRRPASGRHDHDHRAANARRSSRSSRSSSPAAATRRRCTTTPITTCRPRISRIPDVSYVTVQGGDIREILVEVDPQALVAAGPLDRRRRRPAGQGTPAQGRRPARSRKRSSIRCWPTPWRPIRSTWKTA